MMIGMTRPALLLLFIGVLAAAGWLWSALAVEEAPPAAATAKPRRDCVYDLRNETGY